MAIPTPVCCTVPTIDELPRTVVVFSKSSLSVTLFVRCGYKTLSWESVGYSPTAGRRALPSSWFRVESSVFIYYLRQPDLTTPYNVL